MSTPNSKPDYLLLSRGERWYDELPLEELQQVIQQNQAWIDRLIAQGKVKAGQALLPEGAIVAAQGGRVTDGPFVESKEAIGGYLLLQADSLEEAVAIAQSLPSVRYGTVIEIRPVAEECPIQARARQLAEEERPVHTAP